MRHLLIAALAASGLIAAGGLVPTNAIAQGDTTQVLKTELQGEEGREANIVRFEVQPGWETERHIHPGHVFVYVTDGTLQVDVEGEPQRTVSAGDTFYEVPDKPMIARTARTEEGAKFIVFQIGPAGEPIMVPRPQ
jgi:quercetin dioxygenase-like cupin family protein